MQLLRLSGGGVASTPDSANLSITDNLDLRIRVTMDNWSPIGAGSEQTFIAKRAGGDEWQFRTHFSSGQLNFVWWDTGGVATSEIPFADHGFENGSTHWIRVRRSGTSVNFWTSDDDTNDHTAVSWTPLGATQATPAGSIRSTVATHVTIGSRSTGAVDPLYGFVHAAAVVDNVTTRADPVFASSAEWTVGEDAGDTASDGVNTWTLGGTAEIVGDNLPKLPGVIITVDAGFGSNPFDDSLIWTDITEDVRTIHTERGKQYELDRIDQGIATLELENFDGKYNAHNTTSPYFPNVKPMVPIRIRAVYNGSVYPVWSGFVERWPVSTTPDNSLVSVQCADLFKPLAMADVAQENRTTAVEALNPVAWWRFADETDTVGGHDLSFAGTPTEGVDGYWAGDLATTFDGTDDAATVTSQNDVIREGLDKSYEFWVKPTSSSATFENILDITSTTLGNRAALLYDGSGQRFLFHNGIVPVTAAPNEWHHVAMTFTASGTVWQFYVNGVFVGSTSFPGFSPVTTSTTVYVGRDSGGAASSFFQGDISEIVVYPTVLTVPQIQGLYNTQNEGFATQLTGERIEFILAESEFLGAPVTTFDLDPGQTVMSGVNSPTDVTALEAIQQAVDTERGWFYIAADGTPTFRNRHYRTLDQITPLATVDESDYDFVQAGVDEELLANDVIVGTPDVTFQARDDTSVDEFGRRTITFTIYPEDQNEGYDFAFYLLGQHANPETRISSLDFRIVEVSPIDTLLGAELGNRYNIEVPLAGDDLDLDVYLEKVSHDISLEKQWTTSWQLSPASSDQFWLLGVAGFSELGVTTRLGY